MALAPGTRVGGYEIIKSVGAGGMGEVYRARDTRLGRHVAIKVLPEHFADDPDRLLRFEREAQTLASLNHPNVAQIFGVLEHPSALAMEFVDGEDLAQRMARSPAGLPADEAIVLARQIADALDAAHGRGIVHRDLKPANIRIAPDGTVKVLDFGLAKPADTPTDSAAITSPAVLTQAGLILGTAAYMSPEQARGGSIDPRTDIWAFGVILFEMLAGRRPFDGGSVSEAIASVLKTEPEWTALPQSTPPSVRRLLRRCLDKDPRRRLRSIADARLDLDDAGEPLAGPKAAPARRSVNVFGLAAVAALALIGIANGAGLLRWKSAPDTGGARPMRTSLLPPPGEQILPDSPAVALSPDGSMVAFIVGVAGRSGTQLWVRSLESMAARRLEDGDGAYLPFWSPDSRRIGFFAGTKLKVIDAAGGRSQVLADSAAGRGAAWNASNDIVYAPDGNGPLYRVSANGGTPEALTKLDAARNERGHRFPSFLPDGRHFLYAAVPAKNGRFDIFAGSLEGGSPVLVTSLESAPVFANPGFLLYDRQGVLMVQPFDSNARRPTGDPIALGDEPAGILDPFVAYTAAPNVSVASNGSLAYYSTPSLDSAAGWYDAAARQTASLALPRGHYETVRISPDGTHAALVRTASASESSVWIVDLGSGNATPLSTGGGLNFGPVWSPDSTKIVFSSDRNGASDFYIRAIADAAPEQLFFQSDAVFKVPTDWSSDGRTIIFSQLDQGTALNLYALSADGSGRTTPIANGPSRETGGRLSPDGKWVAYMSDESGRYQVYVQPFPGTGRRVQVSLTGGLVPRWAADGQHLMFGSDDLRQLMRANVIGADGHLKISAPERIGDLPEDVVTMDATSDRQCFLALVPQHTGTGSITVVQHWRAALGR